MPEGPVAIITGASSGIGRAIAESLARDGYRLALVARNEAALAAVADAIGGGDEACLVCPTDLTDGRAVADMVVGVREWSAQRIDVLVNAAGIAGPIDVELWDLPVEEFDRVVATDLRAAFLTMKHVLPVMCRQGRGSIVNIGGTHGMRGKAGRAAYAAAKWGLRGLTQSAALECGPHGVRVNLVAPGPVRTPLLAAQIRERANADVQDERDAWAAYEKSFGGALGRISEPEDIVAAVRFLVSDAARMITGQALVVDGGSIV